MLNDCALCSMDQFVYIFVIHPPNTQTNWNEKDYFNNSKFLGETNSKYYHLMCKKNRVSYSL
jgi:hypothetical protein